MSWHYNPDTGIWDRYADSPEAAEAEIKRINALVASGQTPGAASPEYGQTILALAMLPVASHAATTAILGAATARTAATATATAAGATTAGAGAFGAAGAITGASVLGLATTGAKIGFDIYLLNWLKDNWWIPAILIGGYIGIKMIK